MAEAFVLLTAGCGAGLLVAWLGISALLSLAPADLPRLEDVSLSWPVLGFAMALSSLVAIALGLVTATRATARDPRETLSDGGRGQAGASSQRVGRAIVAAQLAITVVLLVGAALLGRSLLRVLSVNPGFRTDGIVAMDLNLPDSSDPAAKARLSPFYADLFDRLRAIPGVQEVAAVNAVPHGRRFARWHVPRHDGHERRRRSSTISVSFPTEGPDGHGGLLRRVAGLLPSTRHPA